MTQAQIIELILKDYSNGLPMDDLNISKNEVKLWLNTALAAVIEQKYKGDAELESITYMNDAFYATFKSIAITQDTVLDLYTIPLPQVPLGLPKGIPIAAVYFRSNATPLPLSDTVLQITPQEYDVMVGLPAARNKDYGWAEGNIFYIKAYRSLAGHTAIVRMAVSAPQTDTTEIPDGIAMAAADMVIKRLRSRNMPQDISNDGTDQKP